MCIGGSPSVDTSAQFAAQRQAKQARLDEKTRQRKINFGLHQINKIFGGGGRHSSYESWLASMGKVPVGVSHAPGSDATDQGGAAPGAPQEGGGGGEVSGEGAARDAGSVLFNPDARPSEPRPSGARPSGASGVSDATQWLRDHPRDVVRGPGFDPLIERRRQAQLDFQLPQLSERRDDARDELGFSLARAGLSNSSVAADRQSDLGRMFQLEDAKLRSGVESDIANLRSRISGAKQSIEAQLRASADPSAAVNTALSEQERFFAEQPERSTIGDVFAPVAQGIGQAYRFNQTGRLSDRLNAVLSSGATGRSGSGRVVS